MTEVSLLDLQRPSTRPATAEPPFRAFVISLERASARRAHMARLLATTGLAAEFTAAVDGSALSAADRALYDTARGRVDYRAEMSDAEIACYLSHYRLYERIVREEIGVALILEDDIDVAPNFLAVAEALANQSDPEWKVVRLQATRSEVLTPTDDRHRGAPIGHVAGSTLYRLDTHVRGGCAYMIRRCGAEAMLAYGLPITRPIDQTLDRYWENGIMPYVVRPFPAWQDDAIQSEIGVRGRETRREERRIDVVRGRLRRAMDSLNKRAFRIAYNDPRLGLALAGLGVRSARLGLRLAGQLRRDRHPRDSSRAGRVSHELG